MFNININRRKFIIQSLLIYGAVMLLPSIRYNQNKLNKISGEKNYWMLHSNDY